MYISSLIVLGLSSYMLIAMIGLLTYGNTISTDTFVTHMDFSTSGIINDNIMSTIGNLMNIFGYLWLVLAVHTGISLIRDVLTPPIRFMKKVVEFCKVSFGYYDL